MDRLADGRRGRRKRRTRSYGYGRKHRAVSFETSRTTEGRGGRYSGCSTKFFASPKHGPDWEAATQRTSALSIDAALWKRRRCQDPSNESQNPRDTRLYIIAFPRSACPKHLNVYWEGRACCCDVQVAGWNCVTSRRRLAPLNAPGFFLSSCVGAHTHALFHRAVARAAGAPTRRRSRRPGTTKIPPPSLRTRCARPSSRRRCSQRRRVRRGGLEAPLVLENIASLPVGDGEDPTPVRELAVIVIAGTPVAQRKTRVALRSGPMRESLQKCPVA